METAEGKEGIYASLDQFNKGRINVHDLGLTLLPGSQIQTEGGHELEAVSSSGQNGASEIGQESRAGQGVSRTAAAVQRTLSLAPRRNVQPGDLAGTNVRSCAVPGGNASKRKRGGRRSATDTTCSSQDDDEDFGDDENEDRGANRTSMKVLRPPKKRRSTSGVASGAVAVSQGDCQMLLRMNGNPRSDSFDKRQSLLSVVTGTPSSANRNAQRSAGITPAPQPPALPLASSRAGRNASCYASDRLPDSNISTSTSESGLKIQTARQRPAVAQKTLFLYKSRPLANLEHGESFSRSPAVGDRQNCSHQVHSVAKGSEDWYRSNRSRSAPAEALAKADPAPYSASAASRQQRSSYSTARGLNFSSNPDLEQSPSRDQNPVYPDPEVASPSELPRNAQVLAGGRYCSAFGPSFSAVHSHRNESNGSVKLYSRRRRAYSTSDVPQTTPNEACHVTLFSRSSMPNAGFIPIFGSSGYTAQRSFKNNSSSSLRPRTRSTSENNNASSLRPRARSTSRDDYSSFLRPRAHSTSSAMHSIYRYGDKPQDIINQFAATENTFDANFKPIASANERTLLPSTANENNLFNREGYPNGVGYSNSAQSGNDSIYANPFHDTFDNSTCAEFPNTEGYPNGVGYSNSTQSGNDSFYANPFHDTFDNSTRAEFPNTEGYPNGVGYSNSTQSGNDSIYANSLHDTFDNSTRAEIPNNQLSLPAISKQRFTLQTETPVASSMWSRQDKGHLTVQPIANMDAAYHLGKQSTAWSPYAFGNQMSRTSSSGYGSSCSPHTPFTPDIASYRSQGDHSVFNSSNPQLPYSAQPLSLDTTATSHKLIPQTAEALLHQEQASRIHDLRVHSDGYKSKCDSLNKKVKGWLTVNETTGKTRGQEVKEELAHLRKEVAKKDREILLQKQQIDQWREKNEKLEELLKMRPLPQPKPAAAVIDDQRRRTGSLGSDVSLSSTPQVTIDLTGEDTTSAPAPAVTTKRKTGYWLTGYNPLGKRPRLSLHGAPTPHEQHLLSGSQPEQHQPAASAASSASGTPGSTGADLSDKQRKKDAANAARRAKRQTMNAKRAAQKAAETTRQAAETTRLAAEKRKREDEEAEQRARREEQRRKECAREEVDAHGESDAEGSVGDLLAADLDEALAREAEADAAPE